MNLSTRRLFAAVFFVALFVMTAREITDPDFWWHLRTGQYIVQTGTVPRADVFSGTVAGRPWVAHEWLSEVIIYALFVLGSYPLLVLTFSAIITLAFAFVYVRCDGRPYLAAFAVLLAALASAPTWGVRPQMLSLLLTCVFLWVLEKWRTSPRFIPPVHLPAQELAMQDAWTTNEGLEPPRSQSSGISISSRPLRSLRQSSFRRRLWLLVPMTLLWVNLHSGFALGLVILGLYFFGELVERVIGRSQSAEGGKRDLRTLGLVAAACFLVVLLNPNGATMYIYPLQTLTSHAMQAYIQEWFSPDFHLVEFQPFAWLIFATLAAVGLSGKRLSLTPVLLLVVFGYAGLRSARNIPIFAVIAAPVLAEHLWAIFESRGWAKFLAPAAGGGLIHPQQRVRSVLNAFLLLLVLAAGVARLAIVLSNQGATERSHFPAAAVDFLQAQKVSGTIYDSYSWGGYLIWRLYPAADVFIDGRADVYGDAFIGEYLNAYRGDASWRRLLDRYAVKTVLIEPDAPLVAALAADPQWRRVYADSQAVVWMR